jgi:ribose transport system permease protein
MRALLPALSLAIILAAIFWLQPRSMSYFGLALMLGLAVPIALATLAQMCVITVNDLDLSIGSYVSLIACISATWLHDTPVLGVAAIAGCIAIYAALGSLVHLRRLPSIVVTLGMSFIWSGLAILLLPTPGGSAPGWLHSIMTVRPPFVPFPVIVVAGFGVVTHFALMRSASGVVLRGAGGNEASVGRAGWSLLRIKAAMYALCGLFGALSGVSLIGLTTSADANIALRYTLLSIAGVILGGGEFDGGRISPIGAVLGALTLALAGSALTFLHISPDWQVGAQGAILILVLALRALINRGGA